MSHFCSLWLVILSLYLDCRADSVKLQLYYATCGITSTIPYSEKNLNIRVSNPHWHVRKIPAHVVPISHFEKVRFIFSNAVNQ